jgi:hypothetical protein
MPGKRHPVVAVAHEERLADLIDLDRREVSVRESLRNLVQPVPNVGKAGEKIAVDFAVPVLRPHNLRDGDGPDSGIGAAGGVQPSRHLIQRQEIGLAPARLGRSRARSSLTKPSTLAAFNSCEPACSRKPPASPASGQLNLLELIGSLRTRSLVGVRGVAEPDPRVQAGQPLRCPPAPPPEQLQCLSVFGPRTKLPKHSRHARSRSLGIIRT